jgi:hypothetical protein
MHTLLRFKLERHMTLQEVEKHIASPETTQPQKRLLREVKLLMQLTNARDSADVMDRITAIRFEETARD